MNFKIRDVAPSGGVTEYDRCYLLTYAELLDADRAGLRWEQGAASILGIDTTDGEAARLCWDSHLERARWIIGEGLASALEAFAHKPYLS